MENICHVFPYSIISGIPYKYDIFILSPGSFTESLASRCRNFSFKPLPREFVEHCVSRICKIENSRWIQRFFHTCVFCQVVVFGGPLNTCREQLVLDHQFLPRT